MDSITLCDKCGNAVSFDYQFNLSDNLPVLWRSTGPLPKEDEVPIRQSIADATSELEKLDQAVRDIMRILDNFGAKRRDLETFIERQSARIAPIRRVPNELLERFFGYVSVNTLYHYEAVTFHHRSKVAEVPIWVVGLVCKKWYDVSTQSQTLWNKIKYCGGPVNTIDYTRNKNNLLQAALSRSSNIPLDLQLDDGLDARDMNKSIAKNAHRVRSLDFETKSLRLMKSLCEFPILETLKLYIPPDPAEPLPALQPGWFKDSRLLRHVELTQENFWLQGLELPWDVIEDVSSGQIGNEEIQLLSNLCSNLKTFKISDRFTDPEGPDELPNISNEVLFETLENLIIDDFYWSCPFSIFHALLDKLRVPRLKSLDIQAQPIHFQYHSYYEDVGTWPYESIRSFIGQIAVTLEILRLRNTWSYAESQIMDILSLLPYLREFTYDDWDKKLSFNELLSTRPDSLLPKLEILDLKGHTIVFDEPVLENLSERCGNANLAGTHSYLRKLILLFSAVEFPEDALGRLEDMRRGGTYICINGSYCNWKAKQIVERPLSVASSDYDFDTLSTPSSSD